MTAGRLSRGVTLIELIVSVAIMAILAAGLVQTFRTALVVQEQVIPAQEERSRIERFDDELRKLIGSCFLSADSVVSPSYFIAFSSGSASELSDLGDLPDMLIFTSTGLQPNGAFIGAQGDFETLNEQYGPQGGLAEISLQTTPVGEAPDVSGLFVREQRPSDGDPYQGGWERVMNEDVSAMVFEFWDGTTWTPYWDTTAMDPPRLPASVRITYVLSQRPTERRVLVIRLPASDVTPENPAGLGGTTQP